MFLGIDLGTSSVKVLAASEQRRVQARAEYPAGTSPIEHDTVMIEDAVRRALASLFAQGVSPEEIQGVGLCGHGPSIVFLNPEGQPVTTVVTWQDGRAAEEAEYLRQTMPGFDKDATSYEAKLLWFYRRRPELFAPGYTALYPKDYLFYRLCGRRIVDHSTASAIAYYNCEQKNWDACAPYFPKEVLPDAVPAWEQAGVADTPFAKSCGLLPDTPVYPGGIDAFCEAVGAGGFQPDAAVDGSGTSSCLTRSIPLNPAYSRHVLPDSSLMIRMLNCTGQSYRWLCSLMGKEEMNALQAELTPERPSGLLYLPYLTGERFPIFDEKASGAFLGLTVNTGRREILQGLFEGVAFALCQNLRQMGDGIARVRAVGGANRSSQWLQIKANVTGLVYEQMEEPDASALGAALVAALGSGAYDREGLNRLAAVRQVFEPQPGSTERYAPALALYEGLYPKIKETMHGLYAL